tara:strand:+ start:732 stop:1109 length:378 start_codon:yes stop_codon:yes gene_type:complete
MVFSVIENDRVVESFAKCNNCGITHKVTDICRSQILPTSENSSSLISIQDIAIGLTEGVRNIMESHNKELADYQHLNFLIDNKDTEGFIVLSRESIEGKLQGKILRYKGDGRFGIEPFTAQETLQ